MARLACLAAFLIAAGGAGPVPADTACRIDSLGATICTGPAVRPEPRRQIQSDVQALDRVMPQQDAGKPPTTFVPGYKRGKLGTTFLDGGGRCRTDTLGNLNCR